MKNRLVSILIFILERGGGQICPGCLETDVMGEEPIGRRGTLYACTLIHQAPEGFEAPFAEPPIVVAVANSYGKCYALEAEGTLQSVTLICMTDLISSSPARTDMGFNFYAGVARTQVARS